MHAEDYGTDLTLTCESTVERSFYVSYLKSSMKSALLLRCSYSTLRNVFWLLTIVGLTGIFVMVHKNLELSLSPSVLQDLQ